jgi:hypothetical protein
MMAVTSPEFAEMEVERLRRAALVAGGAFACPLDRDEFEVRSAEHGAAPDMYRFGGVSPPAAQPKRRAPRLRLVVSDRQTE